MSISKYLPPKQYWVFVLNSLMNVIFCSIDSAFANNISLDVIIAYGSYVPIEWIGNHIMRLGGHGYQVIQKSPRTACLVSIITGAALGAILAIFAVPVTHIFEISDIQRTMLQRSIYMYACFCPIESAGRFVQTYITLERKNKLLLMANFITYAPIIIGDYVIWLLKGEAMWFVFTTSLSWTTYLIIVLIAVKFPFLSDKLSMSDAKKIIGYGKDVLLSRVLARIATLVCGHFASTMSEYSYAIHVVALDVVSLAENVRDPAFECALVSLKASKDPPRDARKLFARCGWMEFLLLIAMSALLPIIQHGKVDLPSAYFGVLMYAMSFIVYPLYDTIQGFTLSKGYTRVILVWGAISCIWRIGVMWLFSLWKVNLFIIGFVMFADYATRTLYAIFILRRKASLTKERIDVKWEEVE